MLKRVARALTGVALTPLVAGASIALFRQLSGIRARQTDEIFFLIGAAGYALCHIAFHKPILAYVLAHESTHVLWAWIFGGKVKRFRVSSRGGHVRLTRTNVLVTLAPYFFPLYALLALAGYVAAVALVPESRLKVVLVALVGAGWAFHALLTVGTLRLGQPDVMKTGRSFSYVFIYLLNALILVWLLSVVSDGVSLGGFVMETGSQTRELIVRLHGWVAGALGSL